jgi:hypothetical protein
MLTTLTALDICDNGLWEGGGRAIGQALALKRVLTILDLRNNIGTNGARKIGQAIQVNRAPWQDASSSWLPLSRCTCWGE